MSHDPKPLGGKLFSKPIIIFGPLVILCVLLIVKRLVFGLGSVSDLNGGYPWGIWIAFDLLIGTGFACGGWALAWAVYVFNKGISPAGASGAAGEPAGIFTGRIVYHH